MAGFLSYRHKPTDYVLVSRPRIAHIIKAKQCWDTLKSLATQTGWRSIQALTVKKAKQPCCPYCVLGTGFRPMRVLSNGRQICEKCGHIVFPNDTAFRCPCPKCMDVNLSPRIRDLRRR
jgi:hypothetical protein